MAGTWKPDPTSWRTTPRPKGWKNIRQAVIKRDGGRCTWVVSEKGGGSWTQWAHPDRCPLPGVDVDHMGEPDDHRMEMLRLLCKDHHNVDTQHRAAAGRAVRRQTRFRKPERHPGLVTQRHGGGG